MNKQAIAWSSPLIPFLCYFLRTVSIVKENNIDQMNARIAVFCSRCLPKNEIKKMKKLYVPQNGIIKNYNLFCKIKLLYLMMKRK